MVIFFIKLLIIGIDIPDTFVSFQNQTMIKKKRDKKIIKIVQIKKFKNQKHNLPPYGQCNLL